MTNHEKITYLFIFGGILVGLSISVGSYFLGRYHASLLNKIRTLKEQGTKEPAPAPSVLMGNYAPPKEIGAPDGRATGISEPKTPERVEWEAEQALKKEALGR